MNRTLSNIPPKSRQYLLVFAALVLVLLTSCPIKSGIKTLIGLPAKTGQGIAKSNSHFFSNNPDRCINSETTETTVSQAVSVDAGNSLPAALLTAAFLFLSGIICGKEPSHPRYGNLKIPGSLPIFLRYRRLLI